MNIGKIKMIGGITALALVWGGFGIFAMHKVKTYKNPNTSADVDVFYKTAAKIYEQGVKDGKQGVVLTKEEVARMAKTNLQDALNAFKVVFKK